MIRPEWFNRLREALNRPLFGTVVIPPNATVPPHAFPEDEFPVYCSRCDYLLSGLSEDRCPECGEPFDRGRLLVEQYVHEKDHRLWQRGGLSTWAGRVAAGVLVLVALYVGATHLAWWFSPVTQKLVKPTARQVDGWVSLLQFAHEVMWLGQWVLLAVLLGWVLMLLRAGRGNARKRERVLQAIR